MRINQILSFFTDINKDVPLVNISGTSLYLDDLLLITLVIILLNEKNMDTLLLSIFLLLIFS